MTATKKKYRFPAINSVRALPDFKIAVEFRCGETRIYDVKPWFERQPKYFKHLKQNRYFYDVVSLTYSVEWDDDTGFSCDELYYGGKKAKTPFDDLVTLPDALKWWDIKEKTLMKAVENGDLLDNIDVRQFGKVTLFSRKAIVRLFGPQKKEY